MNVPLQCLSQCSFMLCCSAPQHGIPVCPHAGGVGLCELVQHLSMFDFVCVSGTMEGRCSSSSTVRVVRRFVPTDSLLSG